MSGHNPLCPSVSMGHEKPSWKIFKQALVYVTRTYMGHKHITFRKFQQCISDIRDIFALLPTTSFFHVFAMSLQCICHLYTQICRGITQDVLQILTELPVYQHLCYVCDMVISQLWESSMFVMHGSIMLRLLKRGEAGSGASFPRWQLPSIMPRQKRLAKRAVVSIRTPSLVEVDEDKDSPEETRSSGYEAHTVPSASSVTVPETSNDAAHASAQSLAASASQSEVDWRPSSQATDYKITRLQGCCKET